MSMTLEFTDGVSPVYKFYVRRKAEVMLGGIRKPLRLRTSIKKQFEKFVVTMILNQGGRAYTAIVELRNCFDAIDESLTSVQTQLKSDLERRQAKRRAVGT